MKLFYELKSSGGKGSKKVLRLFVNAKFESNLSNLKFRHFGPARRGGQNFKVLRFDSNLA